MRASHILIEHRMKWPPSKQRHPRSEAEAEKLANELLNRILAGESFEDVARAHSECPSASDGGDLGRFSHDQMAKRFSDAAFALEPYELSPPVRTEFGIHLILRTE